MSTFPTLYELSLDVVVDCFKIGFLPTSHIKVSPAVQKEVFESAMKAGDCYDNHTRALIEMFQPTKLELNFKNTETGTFTEIQKLKLTELKIENFESFSMYKARVSIPKLQRKFARLFIFNNYSRIDCFLDEILSHETKQNLRVLDLSEEKTFGEDWMEELSFMFPNLEVLNIRDMVMCEEGFTSLCNNLPNLRFLDITGTGIDSLNGISKLQNLEYLNIDSLFFEAKEDIKELFELKNLKQLVFSDNVEDEWNHDWFFEKPLPELRTLVCRWEGADNDFLRRILPKLAKLKTVVACGTEITQAVALPGVSVYTTETIEAMMKAIGYFRIQGDWKGVVQVINHFNEMYCGRTGIERVCTSEQMTLMVNELEAVIRHFKLGRRVLPDEAREFFVTSLDFLIGDNEHLNINKLKVIDMLLIELKNHLNEGSPPTETSLKVLWNGIDTLIRSTENFNVDKVCSIAMKSIIYGSGDFDWEPLCATILETFIDRMDLSSEYYRNINFRELHESLSNIQNRTDLWAERRASAGNVLRFVELFM